MLDELIGRYALRNEAEGKSPATIRWYGDILRQYLRYLKANGVVPDASAVTLQRARDYLCHLLGRTPFEGHPHPPAVTRPISPMTARCHARSLKAFASWLAEEGYTSDNRLQHLKLPKAPEVMVEPLSPAEIYIYWA